ncbi:acetyltransferase [Gluconobacter thailandicus]|nr:acetyltransferase [Gluconobacter thailandicus]
MSRLFFFSVEGKLHLKKARSVLTGLENVLFSRCILLSPMIHGFAKRVK